MITLSHLLITGNINSFTPKIVIQEICRLNEVRDISELSKKKIYTLTSDIKERDINFIKKFVNPYVKWDLNNLLKALRFITFFMGESIRVKFDPKNIGLPTNENPFSLSNCLLYRICREWSIPTQENTTTRDMVNYITLTLELNEYPQEAKKMRNFLIEKISGDNPLSREDYREKLLFFIDNDMKKVRDPHSNVEAVAAMAQEKKIDISYSKNPFIDYYYYQEKNEFIDEKLREIEKFNPVILDLNRSFNPIFPPYFYDRRKLRAMLKKRGFERMIHSDDLYNLLEIDHYTNNFQIGWRPEAKDDSTSVEKIPLGEVLIDGTSLFSYGNVIDGYYFYTLNELKSIYQHYKSFIVPSNVEEPLSSESISRLIFLTREDREMTDLLNSISARDVQYDNETLSLSRWFQEKDEEDKEYIRFILMTLIEASMYMRGWNGESDSYPLKRRFVVDEEKIEEKIREKIEILGSEYHKNEIAKTILSLPLYKYSYYRWKRNQDKYDGLTIWDRIEMVALGEGQRSISSCYKMSSNFLASSGYRYMIVFGLQEPFRIDKLEQIAD